MTKVKIQFLGDISLDGIYCDPSNHSSISENMKALNNFLPKPNIRIVNWESPLWGDGGINELKFPRLTTTRSAALALNNFDISIASLANNHFYDNLMPGYLNTKIALNDLGIEAIGVSEKKHQDLLVTKTFSVGSITIIPCISPDTHPNVPDNTGLKYIEYNFNDIKNLIISQKDKGNRVIVYVHWGEQELTRIPSPAQRTEARALIDLGADAVIGCHVHCIQGAEIWGDGYIAYSLGNFLFSPDLIVPGAAHSPRTSDTFDALMLEATVSYDKVDWKPYFLRRKKRSLLFEIGNNSDVMKYFNRRSLVLRLPRILYYLAYKVECVASPIRNFIDKNNGVLKAILSIRIKQIYLLIKILFKR